MLKNLKQPQLSSEDAFLLAEQFTLIPNFPRYQGAIDAVANWLLDHCSRDQAETVVTKAVRTWGGEWTGLWDLEAVVDRLSEPGVPLFVPYEKPPELCVACGNTGVFGHSEGSYVRCSCSYGQQTPDEYIALCNRPPRKLERITARDLPAVPLPPLPERRITQADIDRARLERDKKREVS